MFDFNVCGIVFVVVDEVNMVDIKGG